MEHRVCSRSVGTCCDDKFGHGTYTEKYSETCQALELYVPSPEINQSLQESHMTVKTL
jgi:hypothetical protein